jgi:hypothetical protein
VGQRAVDSVNVREGAPVGELRLLTDREFEFESGERRVEMVNWKRVRQEKCEGRAAKPEGQGRVDTERIDCHTCKVTRTAALRVF